MNLRLCIAILLLLSLQTALSAPVAEPITSRSSIGQGLMLKPYNPCFHKQKKSKPIRRKMVLSSPIHLECDDSEETNSGKSHTPSPLSFGDRHGMDYLLAARMASRRAQWQHSLGAWKTCYLTPDSPPPQRVA